MSVFKNAIAKICNECHGEYQKENEELRRLLSDARSVLEYWQQSITSVTSNRVKTELLPAINKALASSKGNLLDHSS